MEDGFGQGTLRPRKAAWYTTWWGVILLGMLAVLLLFVGSVAVLTARYVGQIKSGQPVARPATSQVRTSTAQSLQLMATDDDPALGRPNAPVTIVEFVDFKCPICKEAHPILKRVMERYGHKIRLVIRDFPIETLHPGATRLAEVAHCAAAQGRFWQMHDILFTEQDSIPAELTPEALEYLMNKASVEKEKFKTCLESPETSQEVRGDYLDGITQGVQATPTFFVNGQKVEGLVPFTVWDEFLSTIK